MFHPLATLFRRTKLGWQEADLKHFVQDYLRQRLKTDALYCEKVFNGVVAVRVNSPAAHQEVNLLEFDLARDLKKHTNYDLRQLIVYKN